MLGHKTTVARLRLTPTEKIEWQAAARRFGDERAALRGFRYRSDDCNLSDFIRACVEAWIKSHPAKSNEKQKAKRRRVKT